MKKTILFIGIAFIAIIGIWFISSSDAADNTPVSIGELDTLNLVNLDSVKLQLTKADMRNSLMAVVFNPWCEHCQAEAQEMYNNMNQLKDVTIIMIGTVSIEALESFSIRYGLGNFKNVIFAYSNPVAAYKLFGAYQLPFIRLYDKNLKPVKDFSSNTEVSEIVSYIK